MRALMIMVLPILAGCATGPTPVANPDDRPRYDYVDDEYEHADPGEELQYNYMEDRYEYADPGAEPRYNYMEDEYELAD